MEKIVIIGGGSFIGNLINYIEDMNQYEVIGYTDMEDRGNFWGVPYLGNDSILSVLYTQGVTKAAIAIGNRLNNTTIKQKIVNNAKAIGFL